MPKLFGKRKAKFESRLFRVLYFYLICAHPRMSSREKKAAAALPGIEEGNAEGKFIKIFLTLSVFFLFTCARILAYEL